MTNPGTFRPDQFAYGAPENRYGAPAAPAQTASHAPQANGGWAAATLIFFWPLAFLAFSRALSVPTLWSEGRYDEAREASASVARIGKIATAIGILVGLGVVAYGIASMWVLTDADASLRNSSGY